MSLEDRLRQALRRTEPGADFAANVLARLDDPATPAVVVVRTQPRRVAHWALAASVLLAVGVGLFAQRQYVRARNESAGRQLAYALELTSRELENVHQHLERKTQEKGS